MKTLLIWATALISMFVLTFAVIIPWLMSEPQHIAVMVGSLVVVGWFPLLAFVLGKLLESLRPKLD